MSSLVDELQWRGLIAQSTDEVALRDALEAGPVTYYCGFDPTAASLHHGHLVQLVLLRHLQLAGHCPIALVGGATGLIGDPRMSGERTLNDPVIVSQWVENLRGQIENFLDFDGENPARLVNNLEWTAGLSAIDFLRDIGKHFRLGTMLAKDTVARRLSSEEGISFTEFSYQILQGLDYLELFRQHGVTLQTGGNDQWGNLLAGVELIRKVEGKSVHVLTTPLITKADGTKFGKSEGGAVWLSPDLMSPYDFFQFWINVDDADVVGYLKVFTFLDRGRIESLAGEHAINPGARVAQRTLAREVTTLVHGAEAADEAESAAAALFGRAELGELSASTLRAATAQLPHAVLEANATVVDALVATGLAQGRSDARRTVAEGGAYFNNAKVENEDLQLRELGELAGGLALLRRGKRKLAAVTFSPAV